MERKKYATQEIKELKTAIRTGEPLIQIARRYSTKWNRPLSSMYQKVISIAKHTTKIAVWNGAKRVRAVKQAPIRQEAKFVMPKGFTFDFTPTRAEMHEDRVVLYF